MRSTQALALLLACALLRIQSPAEEGMYPINLIGTLDLRAKGLQLDARSLYNPDSVGLIDGVVKLGGCTGSFVSADGLILTNHHCVFGYVQAASSKDHDYVTDGYLARTRAEEIRAVGGTVRITESYRDVSREITSVLADTMDAALRSKAIADRIRDLVNEEEGRHPGKSVQISEMIPGESYILFRYALIRDVRLVYVPPRAIGEYGGETDNWMWPRHTGDFSFVRAYVAPDGTPAEYSPQNVPYHPRTFLRVQAAGVAEGDPVFILGYPGRTYRHRTSHYMAYEEQVRMPYIAELNKAHIAIMERFGAGDRAIALKYDARVKGLANAAKNYLGKMQGMTRLQLVRKKEAEEKRLQQFILADTARARRYGTTLQELEDLYRDMGSAAPYEFVLDNLRSSSALLGLGFTLHDIQGRIRRAMNPEGAAEVDTTALRTSMDGFRSAVKGSLKNFYAPADKALLRDMLIRASRLPAAQQIGPLDEAFGDVKDTLAAIDNFLDDLYEETDLTDSQEMLELANSSPECVVEMSEPFVDLAASLSPLYTRLSQARHTREARLSKLSADLLKVRREFLKADFIPDANSTLRFTSGKVRGYSPADATYCSPITTLDGVIEKATGVEPFDPPASLVELYRSGRRSRFALPGTNKIPVGLLYDLDTTGGSSGSPLLNARGELVGVNFDRTFEATINDYGWSDRYSRSIAVDIRYVLWVTSEIGGADHLLGEMGVTPGKES